MVLAQKISFKTQCQQQIDPDYNQVTQSINPKYRRRRASPYSKHLRMTGIPQSRYNLCCGSTFHCITVALFKTLRARIIPKLFLRVQLLITQNQLSIRI